MSKKIQHSLGDVVKCIDNIIPHVHSPTKQPLKLPLSKRRNYYVSWVDCDRDATGKIEAEVSLALTPTAGDRGLMFYFARRFNLIRRKV